MINLYFDRADLTLIVEALAKAASRHESEGHDTKGRYRREHDDKAEKMRTLRATIVKRIKNAA